jgi:1-pyrroline-5-carboxylate dehydrogenase
VRRQVGAARSVARKGLIEFFWCSTGYFIEPTIVVTKDPLDKIMTEEIFGPVLSIYVYKDDKLKETMEMVGSSTQFALTGAVFAQDENWLKTALDDFKMTAGNFYVNDKSTGSIVGQQPFGGARLSGNDSRNEMKLMFSNDSCCGARP